MDQAKLSRPVVQKLRALCLAFPETSETRSWGHPNFRAGKRIFSAFEIVKGRPSIAFRLEPIDINLLLRKKNFFATPYGQGRWASVWVDGSVDWRLVARLLDCSYRTVANKRMITALAGARMRSASLLRVPNALRRPK
jgi:predicted DNA-binding protein (MmcQ/YjbR family)